MHWHDNRDLPIVSFLDRGEDWRWWWYLCRLLVDVPGAEPACDSALRDFGSAMPLVAGRVWVLLGLDPFPTKEQLE